TMPFSTVGVTVPSNAGFSSLSRRTTALTCCSAGIPATVRSHRSASVMGADSLLIRTTCRPFRSTLTTSRLTTFPSRLPSTLPAPAALHPVLAGLEAHPPGPRAGDHHVAAVHGHADAGVIDLHDQRALRGEQADHGAAHVSHAGRLAHAQADAKQDECGRGPV